MKGKRGSSRMKLVDVQSSSRPHYGASTVGLWVSCDPAGLQGWSSSGKRGLWDSVSPGWRALHGVRQPRGSSL
ncbi:hypothetical protein JOQ06_000902, partial [Pogonophryne albipinna]